MQAHMADGLSAAQAARAALAGRAPRGSRSLAGAADGPAASELDAPARTLRSALTRLDRELAEQALDRLLAAFTFETVISEVLLYLADVGAVTMPVELSEIVDELKGLASSRRLLLAGPAAYDRLAQQIGATILASDPITAAAALEDQLTPKRPRFAAGADGPG
jgi:hypothetical protein